jgi:predicted lipoprotein with Yx(FWY)xxD motif
MELNARHRMLMAAALVAAIAAALVGAQARAATVGTLRLATTPLGKILVDSRGHTLYLFERDKSTKSTCYGTCAKDWPPFLVSTRPHAGSGVKSTLLGTTRRNDGRLQVTYHGHPLYAFFLDKQAGQMKGQGLAFFGGAWYVLGANGVKIAGKAATTSSSSSGTGSETGSGSTGGGSYGGGGYGGG